jgi:hypothetical protein
MFERFRKQRGGWLRVIGYCAALTVFSGAYQLKHARAEVADQSLIVGRRMLSVVDTKSADITKVSLNGETIFVGSSLTDESLPTVLSRYAEHCEANSAQSPEEWKKLASPDSKNAVPVPGDGATVTRGGDGSEEGTIVCFTRSAGSKASVKDALTNFAQTGELGALGGLRYVYAKKTARGGTHILSAWTLDSFNVKKLAPEGNEDVRGSDFAQLPLARPDGSQRILSARIEGQPYGINVYESDQEPAAVASAFDEKLIKEGWIAIDVELAKHSPDAPKNAVGHIYEKDGMILSLSSHPEKKKTVTALGLSGTDAMASNTPKR